ncbi:hypothetical protein [uncultured Sphingomonas sp.]|uniref:hypothetical protein n=1 Tax=uncultured Sphingomonas sp. TaxID=158754 RepID=UPI002611CDF1|nr:hypothetical protein [uncultured Sphingomonas sp.]
MRSFPRIREIADAFGARLQVRVEETPTGALLVIERPDMAGRPRATLDGYAAEVLAGYIMSARLAVPHPLPEEIADGAYPTRFEMEMEPCAALRLTQQRAIALEIPTPFWDRLYAELCLATAHMRELDRRANNRPH